MTTAPDHEGVYASPMGIGALRQRLRRDGWLVETHSDGIHVINPELPALEEHIILKDRTDGRWFAFGWGQAFAPAHDIELAITCIRRVLGTPEI